MDVTELVMGRAKDSAFNKPSPSSLSVAGLETERKVEHEVRSTRA